MKTTLLWGCVALLVGLTETRSIAGTILGTEGQKCYPSTYSTSLKSTISVFGDWIETIGSATTTAAGVNVSIVDKFNGFQHQTPPFAGKGMVTLKITTNNANAGDKTIKLSGGVFGEATFTITVAASPSVTGVDIPTPADPFKEIVVTLNGTGLQDAADPASGIIVRDNLIPFITVGGDVNVSSVRVLSSSNSSLQAKLIFSGFIQDATVALTFRRSGNSCVPMTNGLKHSVRVKSSNIKNYVKSITFPNGSTFDKNSIATININLLFPAPSPGTNTVTLGGRTVRVPVFNSNLDDRKVFFKLIPANAFEAVPNGTPINATGFSEVLASVGDDIIPLTFKIKDCLGGQPGTVNSVKIQTWMHNTNTSLPPDFIEHTFGVRCVQ